MKTLIILNERAGNHSAKHLQELIASELKHYPVHRRQAVEVFIPETIESLHQEIRSRQDQLERVIAAGGDGTVLQVISAIRPYPHLKLGILPVGTGNRLASNLGIPLHLKGALDTALNGEPYWIDIGRINNGYFALMAGAGLDAEIMDKVLPGEKKAMGIFAYFWQGVKRAFEMPYAIFEIEADGQRIRARGIGVVVANAGNLLGRYFTLTPGAQVDDGLLDVCILASRNRSDYWTAIIQILSQEHRGIHQSGLRHLRAKHIRIRSRPRVKTQADGDVIGITPIEIEAIPNAVAVYVPKLKKQGNLLTESLHAAAEHLKNVIQDLLPPKF